MATATKKTTRKKSPRFSTGDLAGNGAVKAKASKEPEKIVIQKPDLRTFSVNLVGSTPLIQHKFSEKAKKAIEDKQQQKQKQGKGKRDPHAEYLAACYAMPGHKPGDKKCVYAVPSRQIKAAMVEACRFVDGLHMTIARGAVQVLSEDSGMIPLKFRKMAMREDAIKLPNKNLDLRYRPEFSGWSIKVSLKYNAAAISAEQLVNLLTLAGFHCGLGELRPNSKSGPGGENGMFDVKTAR